jgi:two-component system, OmpR family, response regulator ArlR
MSARILIIEDEKQLARLIELELTHEGYQAEVAYDGLEGIEKFKQGDFQLVLLDIMLPEIDGIKVCQQIRAFSSIPVIMVTARDSIPDKVKGLDIGADDYLTKPFATEELLARIRALLRRQKGNNQEGSLLQVADLVVDIARYEVKRNGDLIDLTKKEYDLLVYMIKNKGIVLSREEILNKIWGYDYLGETNIVDVYIRYLRSKIDDPYSDKLIQTVRGVGYVIRDDQS